MGISAPGGLRNSDSGSVTKNAEIVKHRGTSGAKKNGGKVPPSSAGNFRRYWLLRLLRCHVRLVALGNDPLRVVGQLFRLREQFERLVDLWVAFGADNES